MLASHVLLIEYSFFQIASMYSTWKISYTKKYCHTMKIWKGRKFVINSQGATCRNYYLYSFSKLRKYSSLQVDSHFFLNCFSRRKRIYNWSTIILRSCNRSCSSIFAEFVFWNRYGFNQERIKCFLINLTRKFTKRIDTTYSRWKCFREINWLLAAISRIWEWI